MRFMKRQVLLPLLAFVIALIPGIIFVGLPFPFDTRVLDAYLLYLPFSLVWGTIFYLINKIQHQGKKQAWIYASWTALLITTVHIFLYYLHSAMIGSYPPILTLGLIIASLSALLFYFIAHISSPILRLSTAFLAAAAIIIGYGWWIFG